MDNIQTGVFEISTKYNEFWKDWQEDLAGEELRRRARVAMERIQRPGTPYMVCLYPVERREDRLVLIGFCVLAKWEDCKPGEACTDDPIYSLGGLFDNRFKLEAYSLGGLFNNRFKLEPWSLPHRHEYEIRIYRRVK